MLSTLFFWFLQARDTADLDIVLDSAVEKIVPLIENAHPDVQDGFLVSLSRYHFQFDLHSEKQYITQTLAIKIQNALDRRALAFACVAWAPICEKWWDTHCNLIACEDDTDNYYHFFERIDDDRIYTDPVYATDRNLAWRVLDSYEAPKVIVEKSMEASIREAYDQVQWFVDNVPQLKEALGWNELVFILKDVYRPYDGSVDLFESAMHQWISPVYITYGWDHTRGAAIDLTLWLRDIQGEVTELRMGSTFDEFHTERVVWSWTETWWVAHHAEEMWRTREWDGSDAYLSYEEKWFASIDMNPMTLRALLRESMVRAWFKPYDKEWWHYAIVAIRNTHPRYYFPIY